MGGSFLKYGGRVGSFCRDFYPKKGSMLARQEPDVQIPFVQTLFNDHNWYLFRALVSES